MLFYLSHTPSPFLLCFSDRVSCFLPSPASDLDPPSYLSLLCSWDDRCTPPCPDSPAFFFLISRGELRRQVVVTTSMRSGLPCNHKWHCWHAAPGLLSLAICHRRECPQGMRRLCEWDGFLCFLLCLLWRAQRPLLLIKALQIWEGAAVPKLITLGVCEALW
jgi:hypothetical protein